MKSLIIITQVFFFIAMAPLISGVIKKIKNNIRMRKGPGILQPYYNLAKLFGKDEVVSENSSWIFRTTPLKMGLSSSTPSIILLPRIL